MGIQNQEEHIGHEKQLKSDRYQDRNSHRGSKLLTLEVHIYKGPQTATFWKIK